MTLIIADDEELIRFSVRDMIRESGIDFNGIREAATGKQVIEMCRQEVPDIVLLDIKMPGKSGLEAMEELSDIETLWIILTGHADFEFARKALQLGAEDYLVKPPSPEELARIFHKAADKIKEKEQARHIDFERKLTWVFNNTSSPSFDPLFTEKGIWYGWVVCLDSGLIQKETLKEQTRLSIALRKDFLSSLNRGCRGALTTTDRGKLEITVFGEGETTSPVSGITKILQEMELSRRELKLTFLPVEEKPSFREYTKALEETESTASLRLLESPQCLPDPVNPEVLEYSEKLENLLNLTGSSRKTELYELTQELKEIDSPLSSAQEEHARSFFQSLLPDLKDIRSFQDLIQSFPGENEDDHQDGSSILVQQALRIIREEYNKETGIAQIAYKLQVTPNYLSSLFHKHTGIPFTRYITEIRMNKARQLLKETNLNIKEIAQQVGYHSSRHFSGLFRQETGLTPSEYIKKYRI